MVMMAHAGPVQASNHATHHLLQQKSTFDLSMFLVILLKELCGTAAEDKVRDKNRRSEGWWQYKR